MSAPPPLHRARVLYGLGSLACGLLACGGPGPSPERTGDVVASARQATGASASAAGATGAPAASGAVAEAQLAEPPVQPGASTRDCQRADPHAQCCDRDFGLDPQAVVKACGFKAFSGEFRTATSCQLRFDAGRDTPAAIALSQFEDESFEHALARHMSGFMGASKGDEVEGAGGQEFGEGKLHLSGKGKLAWAYLNGWSEPRRVAWSTAECSAEKMQPLLKAMQAAAPTPKLARTAVMPRSDARPLPAGSHEGANGSLLTKYADRDLVVPETLTLPGHSMRIGVMLLERAAKDTVKDFDKLMAPDARWGLPDRRELRARSVMSDGGWAFLEGLRSAASRFGEDAKFSCPPLSAPGSKLVAEGKAPMWCTYVSADGLDLMVMRMRLRDNEARVEYVGLFETRPTQAMRADGEPPPPPLRPTDPMRAQMKEERRAKKGQPPVPLPVDPRVSPSRP